MIFISRKRRRMRHAARKGKMRNGYKQFYSENKKKSPLGTFKYGKG
jgi:hypothetical protein